ncbi:putative protein kinase [Leptomonas pyrrhocoris]|uniref:Protein kinase domain-containing protein n=1 Tax=Leptomonas pyrrhocoris TaxID=157538 RepID=A0A0M9FVJ7_LEPPY|nr:putative protein kinase [Leptomonas pyrrhocoris]KPA76970.1 putative protein kinase [Leptomonas pyrrhocoris]|eukprot:XP_015655409.1 putative protein kinase [Leptomonas pyrrhocoris]
MFLSLTEHPADPPPPKAQPEALKIDPEVYAVLQECRYRTLTVGNITRRKLDEEISALEALQEAENTQQRCKSGDDGNRDASNGRVEEHSDAQRSEVADKTDSDEELSLFIPTVGSDSDGATSLTEEDLMRAPSNFACFPRPVISNKSWSRTGTRTLASNGNRGKVRKGENLFPCPFGHWECGTFLGKRVFVEASNTFLGRGSQSVVLGGSIIVTETVSGEERRLASVPVAIKEVVYDARQKTVRNMIEFALRFRLEVDHPGIVHIFCVGLYYPPFSSLSELENVPIYSHVSLACSTTGSIADVLKRTGPFPMQEIQRCMAEVLETLQFMHEEHHKVHNDVKSHNTLIFDYTSVFSNYKYQLADFTGLTSARAAAEVRRDVRNGLGEKLTHAIVGGTAAFMSPESCLGLGMLTSNDIWSLGITAYHMATNTLPWQALERQFPSMIINGFRCKFSLDTIFGELTDEGAAASATSPAGARGQSPHVADGSVEKHSGCERPGGNHCMSNSNSGSVGSTVLRDKYADFGPILEEFDHSTLPKDFQDFVRQCLIENPMERPTARQLREHAFVKDIQIGSGRESATTPLPN